VLVEEGIKQAKRMQLPIIIISYKASRGVYARAGFVEAGHITEDDTPFGGQGNYAWHFMVYDTQENN